MNFGLTGTGSFPIRAAPSRLEIKMMAISAGAMAIACITGIDPKRNPIAATIFARLTAHRAIFAAKLQLKPQAGIIPGNPHLSETWFFLQSGQLRQEAFNRQIEQIILLFVGKSGYEKTWIFDAKEK